MRRIARAIGTQSAPVGLWELEQRLGLPMKLADIGMNEADLERAARIAVQAPYPNPRKVEYEGVLGLLHNAYGGRKP
jgi:maleylacetate reductase